jgi:hypothetical protein
LAEELSITTLAASQQQQSVQNGDNEQPIQYSESDIKLLEETKARIKSELAKVKMEHGFARWLFEKVPFLLF